MSLKTGKENYHNQCCVSGHCFYMYRHVHCTYLFEITVSTEKFTNPIETGYILLVTLEVVDAEQ